MSQLSGLRDLYEGLSSGSMTIRRAGVDITKREIDILKREIKAVEEHLAHIKKR